MLTAKITWAVNATYSGARGRVQGAGTLAETGAISLSDGTAAGQADGLFSTAPVINGGDVHTYSLSSGLQDLYGATLDFSAIKAILVEADGENTADLILGGGSWAGFFGDGATVAVRPGCAFMMACQDATGWAVPDDADQLLVTCVDDGSYGLTLLGVSSIISTPAFATAPAIQGVPTVGVPVVCSAGDWSGDPEFSYRWTRGGSVIPGANGETYTPVPSDAGKKLARITVALNVAGSSQVQTTPVLCTASDLDFTDPRNAAVFGH